MQVSEKAIYVLNQDVLQRFVVTKKEVLVPILVKALKSNTHLNNPYLPPDALDHPCAAKLRARAAAAASATDDADGAAAGQAQAAGGAASAASGAGEGAALSFGGYVCNGYSSCLERDLSETPHWRQVCLPLIVPRIAP